MRKPRRKIQLEQYRIETEWSTRLVSKGLLEKLDNELTLILDPLLMNAMPFVDLAAACIVTSTEYAEKIGIPKSKWIYPLGGAWARDSEDCMISILSTWSPANRAQHLSL